MFIDVVHVCVRVPFFFIRHLKETRTITCVMTSTLNLATRLVINSR